MPTFIYYPSYILNKVSIKNYYYLTDNEVNIYNRM